MAASTMPVCAGLPFAFLRTPDPAVRLQGAVPPPAKCAQRTCPRQHKPSAPYGPIWGNPGLMRIVLKSSEGTWLNISNRTCQQS